MKWRSNSFLLLFTFCLCSCSTCSQQKVHTPDMPGEPGILQDGRPKVWSSLSDVGFPILPDSISSMILERYCYTVSYNRESRQPNWVMWKLTGDHVMQRKEGVWNEYREDEELPFEIRSTLEDYASSGYDRGHMCPGGDCNWDDEGRDETFVLSNMCPQNPNLNRGDWKEIEMACRKWAENYGCVHIVCGPIFFKSQEHERIGPNKIPVPEAFFKVVLCADPTAPRGIGFICRNTDGNRKKDFYVNSIRQVERVTGYDFFPALHDEIENVVEREANINDWN